MNDKDATTIDYRDRRKRKFKASFVDDDDKVYEPPKKYVFDQKNYLENLIQTREENDNDNTKDFKNSTIKKLQKITQKTFSTKKKFEKSRKGNVQLYKEIELVGISQELESNLQIKLRKICKYLSSKELNSKIFLKNEELITKNLEPFHKFFNKYTLSLELKNRFLGKNNILIYNSRSKFRSNSKQKIDQIKIEFNEILKNYTEDVQKAWIKKIQKYFQTLRFTIYSTKKEVLSKRFLWLFDIIFENLKLKIIIYLFPEHDFFKKEIQRRSFLNLL